tara:strand:+ start:150 stop:458 length:309 start_codon:yes stop_codon:yes gene_type:complete
MEERKKLADKIKDLDSTRVFKKITPLYTIDWYIKWAASFFILVGMALTSATGFEPINLLTSLLGVIGWLVVGMMWHDRALVFINGVAIFIYSTGILKLMLSQ